MNVRNSGTRQTGLFAPLLGILLALSLGRAVAADPPPTLHALIAVDRPVDLKERLGMALDGERFKRLLEQGCKEAGIPRERCQVRVFSGPDLTQEKIDAYFASLNSSPQDTVVFYYTGHGYAKGAMPKDPFPGKKLDDGRVDYGDVPAFDPSKLMLVFAGGEADGMSRTVIFEHIMKARCRLGIIITDCCADYLKPGAERTQQRVGDPLPAEEGDRIQEAVGRDPIPNGRAFRDLFFGHFGIVSINSSFAGQVSQGQERYGSYFTYALSRILGQRDECFLKQDTLGVGKANWNSIPDPAKDIMLKLPLTSRPGRAGSFPPVVDPSQPVDQEKLKKEVEDFEKQGGLRLSDQEMDEVFFGPVCFNPGILPDESFYDEGRHIYVAAMNATYMIKVMPETDRKDLASGFYEVSAMDATQPNSFKEVRSGWKLAKSFRIEAVRVTERMTDQYRPGNKPLSMVIPAP